MTKNICWLNCIALWLCIFPGPLLPYLIVWFPWRRKLQVKQVLVLGALVAIAQFAAFLVLPYYACGFNSQPFYQAGKVCPIFRVPVIEAYAYFYSYFETAFLWLILAVLAAAFGRCSERPWVDRIVRGVIIIIAGFFLTLVRTFDESINSFLE